MATADKNNLPLKKLEEKLKKKKISLEQELQKFAQKDKILKDDWDTKFPKFNGGSGGQMMEDEAQEVEEYTTKLPLEYNLELHLRDINLALEKIKKGNYGVCEKCGKKIKKERLLVCPEARFCGKCA